MPAAIKAVPSFTEVKVHVDMFARSATALCPGSPPQVVVHHLTAGTPAACWMPVLHQLPMHAYVAAANATYRRN
jgi:hypothetical protein